MEFFLDLWSLVLATAIAMVLESNALLLEIVDELHTAVLHGNIGGDELVGVGGTLIHLLRNVGRASADTLIVGDGIDEVGERLTLEACS